MTQFQRTLKLDQFLSALEATKPIPADRAIRVIRRAMFDIAENVVVGGPFGPGTPVKTGFARAEWIAVLNGGSWKQTGAPGKGSHPDALAGSLALIATAKLGDAVWLLNGVPYIIGLEYGHSSQAPAGMVRLTFSAASEIMRKAVAAEAQ